MTETNGTILSKMRKTVMGTNPRVCDAIMASDFNTNAENALHSVTDRHSERQTRLITQHSSHTQMIARSWWSQ